MNGLGGLASKTKKPCKEPEASSKFLRSFVRVIMPGVAVAAMMMVAARRPDFTQSASRLAVVSTATAKPANLRPRIARHVPDFLSQNHGRAQIVEIGKLKPSLV